MVKVIYLQSQRDQTLCIKHFGPWKVTTLIVYVDDLIVTKNDLEEIKRFKEYLSKEF